MIHKNWFYLFAVALFEICICFALVGGIWNLSTYGDYPYLFQAAVILLFAGMLYLGYLVLRAVSGLGGIIHPPGWFAVGIEIVFVLSIMAAGLYLRLMTIKLLPMNPGSDFLTFYEIADLLSKGALSTEGGGYCDYIAQFPHVFGYPFLLSLLFRVTGASVLTGQYFGLAAGGINIVLVYLIARNIGGRAAGCIALLLQAFWPSQIFFSNFLASEPVFTAMVLFCLLLSVYLLGPKRKKEQRPGRALILHVLLGAALALASAVRPQASIFLVAILLCILFSGFYVPQASPLLTRALSKAWIRAVLVLIGFLLCSTVTTSYIEKTVDRELPGTASSFGYNLMVGVNIESNGTWNDDDAAFFSDTYQASQSASAAHSASLGKAVERVRSDPAGILNLMALKYSYLWKHDDFGIQWNLLFLEQQGNLTPERSALLNQAIVWNDLYYLCMVFLAGVSGLRLWNKKGSRLLIPLLVFVGTVFLHLLFESQNRYLYDILPLFAVLAACGIGIHYKDICDGMSNATVNRDTDYDEAIRYRDVMANAPTDGSKAAAAQEKQSFQTFDMIQAIRDGHVTVTVTEAYTQEGPSEKPPESQKSQEKERDANNAEKTDAGRTGQADTELLIGGKK